MAGAVLVEAVGLAAVIAGDAEGDGFLEVAGADPLAHGGVGAALLEGDAGRGVVGGGLDPPAPAVHGHEVQVAVLDLVEQLVGRVVLGLAGGVVVGGEEQVAGEGHPLALGGLLAQPVLRGVAQEGPDAAILAGIPLGGAEARPLVALQGPVEGAAQVGSEVPGIHLARAALHLPEDDGLAGAEDHAEAPGAVDMEAAGDVDRAPHAEVAGAGAQNAAGGIHLGGSEDPAPRAFVEVGQGQAFFGDHAFGEAGGVVGELQHHGLVEAVGAFATHGGDGKGLQAPGQGPGQALQHRHGRLVCPRRRHHPGRGQRRLGLAEGRGRGNGSRRAGQEGPHLALDPGPGSPGAKPQRHQHAQAAQEAAAAPPPGRRGRGRVLEHQGEVAQAQAVPGAEEGPLNGLVVHEGAVGAAPVLHPPGAALEGEGGVVPRDRGHGQPDRVVHLPAQGGALRRKVDMGGNALERMGDPKPGHGNLGI